MPSRCLECNTISSFNLKGKKARLYCFSHKKEGMIDVKIKSCLECDKRPCFNLGGESVGIYCSGHKKKDMIDIIHKRCLECNTTPCFNIEGTKVGQDCSEHKKEDMIDVINKSCKTHLCYTLIRNKYEGYCLRCFINLFPDKPVCRNYKTKENDVVCRIQESFSNLTWRADKTIHDGCSKKKPDVFLDMGSHIVIAEIDENKHTVYECSCENKRMMELSQDVGHRPIIFIRFNPDGYTDEDGNKIKSCWSYNKLGVTVVTKNKKKEWDARIDCLKEHIAYWIDNVPGKMIETVELYY